jgi:hypothetical protein
MPNLRSLNFAHQDLRNRSFRRQALNGADFRGADIRGCDFSQAQLVGANFTGAKAGQSRQQIVRLGAIVGLVAGIMADLVSQLIFGALGQVPSGSAWGFIVALYISLGMAGGLSGIRSVLKPRSLASQVAGLLSGISSAALAGFYYAGSLSGKNSMMAIVGAVSLGSLMAIVLFRYRTAIVAVIVDTTGAITAYGFAFFIYANGLTWFHIHQIGLGSFMVSLALLYLWLTLNSLVLTYQHIRQVPGTKFRHANLTHTCFEATQFNNTDFEGALRLED